MSFPIKKGVPIPEQTYVVGSNPKGGRSPKYPFRSMEAGDSTSIPLPKGPQRAVERGRVMAAIRNVVKNNPKWRFKTADEMDSKEGSPTKGTLFLNVWRTE